jgi:hypothetical protein
LTPSPASVAVFTGQRLDTDQFLRNLGEQILEHSRRMSCQMHFRPQTVQGSVSVGVVAFSASWDTKEFCSNHANRS